MHPAVSFARASTATYMGGNGLLQTAAVNQPRYEYDASGNYLGLLIEESRTNITLYSASLSSGWVDSAATLATNTGTAPDGTGTASTLTITGTQNNLFRSQTVSSSGTYALSVYSRGAGKQQQFSIYDVSSAHFFYPAPNNLSANWVRYGYAHGITGTAGYFSVQDSRFGGSSSGAIDFWGAQIELSTDSRVTSYIPTTSAAVTRSADIAQATSLSALGVSTTAGTFVIEHDAPSGAPLIYSGSNAILASTGPGKVAIAYDGTGTATSVNGAAVTTGSVLTWSTTLDLLRSPTNGANAHVKTLSWYNTRRSNVELQRLAA